MIFEFLEIEKSLTMAFKKLKWRMTYFFKFSSIAGALHARVFFRARQ